MQLGEAAARKQTLEELATLEQLRHDVVVLVVLNKLNDAHDTRVRLLSQYLQLIHKQLYVDLLLLNLLLLHDLDGKGLASRDLLADAHGTESALTEDRTKVVLRLYAAHEL